MISTLVALMSVLLVEAASKLSIKEELAALSMGASTLTHIYKYAGGIRSSGRFLVNGDLIVTGNMTIDGDSILDTIDTLTASVTKLEAVRDFNQYSVELGSGRLELGNAADCTSLLTVTPFTLSIRYKIGGLLNNNELMMFDAPNFKIAFNSAYSELRIYNSSYGIVASSALTLAPITSKVWKHSLFVVNPSDATISWYQEGYVRTQNLPVTGDGILNAMRPDVNDVIAFGTDESGLFFDEISIWTEAFDQATAVTINNKNRAWNLLATYDGFDHAANLTEWWRFGDGGTSNTADPPAAAFTSLGTGGGELNAVDASLSTSVPLFSTGSSRRRV